jgi:hypothetical protein
VCVATSAALEGAVRVLTAESPPEWVGVTILKLSDVAQDGLKLVAVIMRRLRQANLSAS